MQTVLSGDDGPLAGRFVSSTIAGNHGVATLRTVGFFDDDVSGLVFANNVVDTSGRLAIACWHYSSVPAMPQVSLSAPWSAGNAVVTGDCAASVASAPGMQFGDPRLVGGHAPGTAFRPAPGSPVIDAGDGALAAGIVRDLAGAPRAQGLHVDLGAFETAP